MFQFIVVSLKDGMFNNANVLFKTKFVDGVSTVSRTAQLQSSRNVPRVTAPDTRKDKETAGKSKKVKRPRLEGAQHILD